MAKKTADFDFFLTMKDMLGAKAFGEINKVLDDKWTCSEAAAAKAFASACVAFAAELGQRFGFGADDGDLKHGGEDEDSGPEAG